MLKETKFRKCRPLCLLRVIGCTLTFSFILSGALQIHALAAYGRDPASTDPADSAYSPLISCADWSDTMLHMGLAPYTTTLDQTTYAMENYCGGTENYINARTFYNKRSSYVVHESNSENDRYGF